MTPGLVLNIRLPRVTLSFAAGAAAAMGGVVMQSVLKNPLASPYGLGVSSGAGLGAALVIVSGLGAGALGTLALPAVSLAFGLATVGIAIFLSSRLDRSLSNNTIILTGMVLSLFTNALMSTVSAANPEYSQRILLWQLGSFSGRGWEASAMVAAVAAVCLAGFLRLSPELDAMTFGEEQARALGVELRRVKWVLIVLVAALTGTSVAFAGVIGFVDLIAPHVVRRFFRRAPSPCAAHGGAAGRRVHDGVRSCRAHAGLALGDPGGQHHRPDRRPVLPLCLFFTSPEVRKTCCMWNISPAVTGQSRCRTPW